METKKGNERKTSISSWVDEENPAGLIRVLENTFQEQHHLGGSAWFGEQLPWSEGQGARGGE